MAALGKKRKRTEEESTKPSKKAAKVSATTQISFSSIASDDAFAPIIVKSPGLNLRSNIPFQPYARRKKEIPKHGNGDTITKQELLLHSSDHPTVDYIGREEESGGTDSLLKHYVGVFDPSSGKLELMEARRMTLRGIVRSQQAGPEAMQQRDLTTNMRELRNDLGQTFGTKKARKAIASLTENAIDPDKAAKIAAGNLGKSKLDSNTSAMLASMAEATAGMATRAELQAAVDNAKPRPSANLAAENVNEVYTIESLVGLDIMKSMPARDWQDSIKAKQEIISMSRHVANRIEKASLDVQKLKTLRYLENLLAFYNASKPRRSSRQVPKKEDLRAALAGMPDVVVENIRRKFSTGNEMTKYQVDLLITHVCALALIVDNFEVDMYDLREDLKLETKDMARYFSEIGARVASIGALEGKKLGLDKAGMAQRRIAKLKLPLEFPKAKFSRKK